MENSVVQLEKKRIREVAKEYEEKGYKVFVQPKKNQLPAFLANYRPDVIAVGEHETVILEVKSRVTLSGSEHFSSLAKKINQYPRFRFELIVTNPKNKSSVGEKRLLNEKEITRLAIDARTLVEKKHYEAALLLSWTIAEAALRLLAEREGVMLDRLSSSFVLKHLTSIGLITKSDYRTLERGMEARNSLIHGFKPTRLAYKDVNSLLTVVGRLLEVDQT